ncbi:hypothetical protein [Streptomyces sp. NPDC051219]|uniref:hypothetical protein n=1 Tax=Streptomyces sp. NPDC051219 TaxID=3155283 RepID=UPI00342CEE96
MGGTQRLGRCGLSHAPTLPGAADASSLARTAVRSASPTPAAHAFHEENRAPDSCWVGRPVGYRAKSFGVLKVDPEARWAQTPSAFRFKHLTRIGFGGHYERTLAEFASG